MSTGGGINSAHAGVGVAVLGVTGLLARSTEVSALEERCFRVLNRSAGAAERPVWALMQTGNGLAAVVVISFTMLQRRGDL